jgi:hypothetical protein
MTIRMTLLTTATVLAMAMAACGSEDDSGKIGTLLIEANGEDFVRDGFVSEDGWAIAFDAVYLNVEGPTAYQVQEATQEQGLTMGALRHGGHPHESVPEGAAHVALTGQYFLKLKQDTFEVGRVDDAPIGNYNRLAFNVAPAGADAQGLVAEHQNYSIVMEGLASKDAEQVQFRIRLTEQMQYGDCGPNGTEGVLAEGSEARSEMTFHFDHIFGDFEEGPADTTDEETVNYLAIGFGPFAELASEGQLDMTQEQLGQQMMGATYAQFIDAVRTLGHSGEAHCHLE